MRIAHGIYMLEISANIMGTPSIINPTLIVDNDMVILIDTGFPGQLSKIKEAIEGEGVSFVKLNMVILTHQDIDHVGSLSSILEELTSGVEVLSHEEERVYIQGDKLPVKVAQLKTHLSSLSNEMKEIYEKMKIFYANNSSNVDRTFSDGQELPYCGGITIVYTPGHTPGHICLYIKHHKILIAGDALQVQGGVLIQAPQASNFDTNLSMSSLKKISEYDIETVICYHGGIYKVDTNKRIKELANG